MAQDGSIEVIWHARVPIIKFIDRITGIHVDISFEQNNGVSALNTFEKWREEHPVLPVIVSLVKQFLVMRSLNEVYLGGIGGFSVICLVVSLLRQHPAFFKGDVLAEEHPGEVLMNFLDLYGNKFNHIKTGISMEPPEYFPKTFSSSREPDRLTILDPHDSSNNISGGSSKVQLVLDAFASAYDSLQKRMAELDSLPIEQRRGRSILGSIFSGDYTQFQALRQHFKHVSDIHDLRVGFNDDDDLMFGHSKPHSRPMAPAPRRMHPPSSRPPASNMTGSRSLPPPPPAPRHRPSRQRDTGGDRSRGRRW